VGDVDTGLVMQILEPLWGEKNETASRVRGRIEKILDWAKVNGHRSGENPARWQGHLNHLLPARAKVHKVENHPALPWEQIPEFMVELREQPGLAAKALEFTILTASRSGEARGIPWDGELDLVAKVWTVPGNRMKGGRSHRVHCRSRRSPSSTTCGASGRTITSSLATRLATHYRTWR
jgi:integrase